MNRLISAFSMNKKESEIFYCLIENGLLQASRVAKLNGIPRNTARGTLENLVERGLLSRITRQATHYYAVESSQNILTMLERQKRENQKRIEQKIEAVQSCKEQLHTKSLNKKRPKISFVEGFDGLKRIYDDSLTSQEEIRSWASFDANSTALPHYFQEYYRHRAKKGISIRSIHPDSKLARERLKRSVNERRNSRLCSSEYTWEPEIQIYDDKINIVSWSDHFGLIIQSRDLAEGMKKIFDQNFSLLSSKQVRKSNLHRKDIN